MKIIITENKINKLKHLVKSDGVKYVSEQMGGFDTFCKVFNIEGFMDFLHLFNDLDVVPSEEVEYWTLFRYKKGNNLMIYDRKSKEVYISYREIWSFLEDKFGLKYSDIQGVTKKWLGEVYNLRGITTVKLEDENKTMLGEVYNLRGITTSTSKTGSTSSLGEVYNLRGITTAEIIPHYHTSGWVRSTI